MESNSNSLAAPRLLSAGLLLASTTAVHAATGLVNGDFSSGLEGWQVDVTYNQWDWNSPYYGKLDTDEYDLVYFPDLMREDPNYEEPWVDPDDVFDRVVDVFPTTEWGTDLIGIDEPGVAFIYPAPYVDVRVMDEMGGRWSFYLQKYNISLYQDLFLSAGDSVTGWSRFGSAETHDYLTDSASVHIGGELVWFNNPLNLPDTGWGDYRENDWQPWSFTSEEDGLYRLSLSARQDDQVGSRGYFKDIRITSSVDDTANTALFLGVGLFALAGWKERRRLRGRCLAVR